MILPYFICCDSTSTQVLYYILHTGYPGRKIAMEKYCTNRTGKSSAGRRSVNLASRLLDGLVIYRAELGETGRQLENLLRLNNISSSFDVPYVRRIH